MLNLWDYAQFMVNMLNLWQTCSIYGEHAQFMVNMLNLWWTCSIYGEHAQFMVNMLNLWWTCSIFGEHAQFMVNMLNLWWTCLIWMSKFIYFAVNWFVQSQLIVPHNWIGLEKLPLNDPLNVKIHPLDQKIQWYLFWSQLICTVTADLI